MEDDFDHGDVHAGIGQYEDDHHHIVQDGRRVHGCEKIAPQVPTTKQPEVEGEHRLPFAICRLIIGVTTKKKDSETRQMVIIKRNLSPRKFSWNEMERDKKARVMARTRGMVGIKGRWVGTKRQKSSVAAAYKHRAPRRISRL